MTIECCRLTRAKTQFMASDVIGMGMGHKSQLLPSRDIEGQVGGSKKQASIPMKHVESNTSYHRGRWDYLKGPGEGTR